MRRVKGNQRSDSPKNAWTKGHRQPRTAETQGYQRGWCAPVKNLPLDDCGWGRERQRVKVTMRGVIVCSHEGIKS